MTVTFKLGPRTRPKLVGGWMKWTNMLRKMVRLREQVSLLLQRNPCLGIVTPSGSASKGKLSPGSLSNNIVPCHTASPYPMVGRALQALPYAKYCNRRRRQSILATYTDIPFLCVAHHAPHGVEREVESEEGARGASIYDVLREGARGGGVKKCSTFADKD